jgi:TatD DNase family protein
VLITDSHAHLYWQSYDADRAEVLGRAREAGVLRMVLVGTSPETSLAAFELAAREPGLFPTAGIHPHDAAFSGEDAREAVARLCRREACVGIGETGLDFFKMHSPREPQLECFRWHLALARELGKAVVVHCRDAHEATVELLREAPPPRGVMHCYTMGERELAPYLELGLAISFSGVVTYPANEENRRAARAVPDEALLVETDCPFLAPQGHRGRRNEPALVREVLARLAELRGDSLERLARITSENAARVFGLPPLDAD